jgi:hypothetical protein
VTPFVTARIAQAIEHPDDPWARTYAEDMDSMARALAEVEQREADAKQALAYVWEGLAWKGIGPLDIEKAIRDSRAARGSRP